MSDLKETVWTMAFWIMIALSVSAIGVYGIVQWASSPSKVARYQAMEAQAKADEAIALAKEAEARAEREQARAVTVTAIGSAVEKAIVANAATIVALVKATTAIIWLSIILWAAAQGVFFIRIGRDDRR